MTKIKKHKPGLMLLAAFLLGLIAASPAAAIQHYKVTNLSNFGSFKGLNDSGQVAGTNNGDAVIWSESDGLKSLVTGGAAWDINNNGQVTGSVNYQAFIWSPKTGTMQNLGTLGGSNAIGSALNDMGMVVGASFVSGASGYRAFLWSNENGMENLGTLGGPGSAAWDINNAGQVVGESVNSDYQTHAFVWTRNGGMLDLGIGSALGNNNQGQVVGKETSPAVITRPVLKPAFLWDNTNGLQRLPIFDLKWTVPSQNAAEEINERGQIVGWAGYQGNGGAECGLLWEKGQVYNLNDYVLDNDGYTFTKAWDINEDGQILGWNTSNADYKLRYVLLTPVPEPASMLLLASGLVGMLGIGKKKISGRN